MRAGASSSITPADIGSVSLGHLVDRQADGRNISTQLAEDGGTIRLEQAGTYWASVGAVTVALSACVGTYQAWPGRGITLRGFKALALIGHALAVHTRVAVLEGNVIPGIVWGAVAIDTGLPVVAGNVISRILGDPLECKVAARENELEVAQIDLFRDAAHMQTIAGSIRIGMQRMTPTSSLSPCEPDPRSKLLTSVQVPCASDYRRWCVPTTDG